MHFLRTTVIFVALALALALSGCGNGDANSTSINAPPPAAGQALSNSAAGLGRVDAARRSVTGDGTGSDATTTAADEIATAQASGEGSATPISVQSKPDTAEYVQGVLSAPAGSPLLIIFTNPSQQPHNWVLVEAGQEQAVVDAAKAKNGNPAGIDGVIAWSETITGAETQIEVPSLETGGYTYLSTAPGDYPQMQGALDVK